MKKDLVEKTHHQTFESLRLEDEDGCEFWSARKLAKALEYSEKKQKRHVKTADTILQIISSISSI